MPDFSRLDQDIQETIAIITDTGEFAAADIDRLSRIIRALDNIFMGDTDPELEEKLTELNHEIEEGGRITPEHLETAAKCVKDVRAAMERDGVRYTDFNTKYRFWMEKMAHEEGPLFGNDMPELRSGADKWQPMPLPDRSERIALSGAKYLEEDLNASLSLNTEDGKYYITDVHALVPALYAVEESFPAKGSEYVVIKEKLSSLRKEYESGFIDKNWAPQTHDTLRQALDTMARVDDISLSDMDAQLALRECIHKYASSFQKHNESFVRAKICDTELSPLAKKQARDVEGICNEYARMKDNSSFFHRDSEEYKKMMEKAKAINDFVEAGVYDPSNPDSFKAMRKMQDELFDAANEYAEKKVYRRMKGTDRGIERKNNTLALMEMSAKITVEGDRVKSYQIVTDQAIKDRRLTKHDKTRRSLDDLITAEKADSKQRYGTKEKRTERSRSRSAEQSKAIHSMGQ